jgi:hypothetical protein
MSEHPSKEARVPLKASGGSSERSTLGVGARIRHT